ncbi:hypothetical protein CPB83DRAFT_409227 [Crepidotus variabilis]|uniref:Uncharacterized protein n=1 Tax=Crepidotus variabilis TaxID=179855 RepID=A0A9P6EQZ9_9AGAR|nr:hypothetical protein CPB83DRAFT_409227 [Crepidotus variabilis]
MKKSRSGRSSRNCSGSTLMWSRKEIRIWIPFVSSQMTRKRTEGVAAQGTVSLNGVKIAELSSLFNKLEEQHLQTRRLFSQLLTRGTASDDAPATRDQISSHQSECPILASEREAPTEVEKPTTEESGRTSTMVTTVPPIPAASFIRTHPYHNTSPPTLTPPQDLPGQTTVSPPLRLLVRDSRFKKSSIVVSSAPQDQRQQAGSSYFIPIPLVRDHQHHTPLPATLPLPDSSQSGPLQRRPSRPLSPLSSPRLSLSPDPHVLAKSQSLSPESSEELDFPSSDELLKSLQTKKKARRATRRSPSQARKESDAFIQPAKETLGKRKTCIDSEDIWMIAKKI